MFVYELHSHSWQCLCPYLPETPHGSSDPNIATGTTATATPLSDLSSMESIYAICVRSSYYRLDSGQTSTFLASPEVQDQ